MKQAFISLGEGYSDLFELEQLMKYNHGRTDCVLFLHTTLEEQPKTSVVLIMNPTEDGNFQAMYSIFEGINYPYPDSNKRFELVKSWTEKYQIPVKEFDVKAKHFFYEDALYHQYLIGVLRLQRVIKPMH
ncbi:hypothetical protein BHU61_02655 [Macrococcus epidermidis]|uniref:DUF7147 domain-containing protein n=1 Tax=Macrococcus epidermidis TaxID=1902580 RepID=A0A327ZVW3_9STAP|nr:hypothetical protein [Macrococcus epidermidis]RAK46369.1 hypothetical protein BHU61_02655 [Macrococcus epidermidis]